MVFNIVSSRLIECLPNHSRLTQIKIEIKTFIEEFQILRDVEKKVVKDKNVIIDPFSVRRTVASVLQSSLVGSTERFGGGAKERAIENMKNNCSQEIDNTVLSNQACAWCAKRFSNASLIPDVRSTYCSQKCAEEGRIRRGNSSQAIREQLFLLERGVCCICGIDSHSLFIRIKGLEPSERLNALSNANWTMPKNMSSFQRLLNSPREGDFWQADHIVPVAEGGGDCSLDNLRTLCTPCHLKETEKLRNRLRFTQSKDGSQRDIRDVLFTRPESRKRKSAD